VFFAAAVKNSGCRLKALWVWSSAFNPNPGVLDRASSLGLTELVIRLHTHHPARDFIGFGLLQLVRVHQHPHIRHIIQQRSRHTVNPDRFNPKPGAGSIHCLVVNINHVSNDLNLGALVAKLPQYADEVDWKTSKDDTTRDLKDCYAYLLTSVGNLILSPCVVDFFKTIVSVLSK
jgi:hypothetical protein